MEQITQEVIDKVDDLIAVHGGPKRYSSPPPPGVKPDPDYVPEVGKWFWWYNKKKVWCLREMRERNAHAVGGEKGYSRDYYTINALPATPPEAPSSEDFDLDW